jgi:PAS domain S-box-containing protein
MFETFFAAPLHFTIDLVGFVVCAGAVFLVPARRNLIPNTAGARAVALGCAALAVAAILHGAGFIDADGDRALVVLYGFGAASILAGVVGGGSPKSRLARLGLAALLLGSSIALAERDPDLSLEAGASDGTFWAVHGLRFGAYLALLWWLWAGVRASVRTRFVAAYATLLVAVVLALSTTLTGVISANVEREELDRVATQLGSAAASIEDQEVAMSRYVRLIATADTVRAAVASRADLDRLAADFTEGGPFPLDVAIFTTPRGRLLGYGGDGPVLDGNNRSPQPLPRAFVFSILGSPVLTESVIASGGELAVSIDRIDERTVALVAAAEIRDPDVPSQRAGVIAAVIYLDRLTVEAISADFRPTYATLFLDGRAIATDVPGRSAGGMRLPAQARSLAGGRPTTLKQVISDDAYFSAFVPLEAEAGEPFLALSSPAEIIATTRRDVTRTLFLVALAAGVAALVLAWLSGRRITGPIRALTATARAVREGDLSARAQVSGDDEVGQLGETFNQMTTSLIATTREEQALRARIETIIQSMADGLVAVDAEMKVLAFNIEAELLTGIRAEDAIGKPVEDVLEVKDADGRAVTLPIHRLTEGAVSGVYIPRRHGVPVPVAVTSAVLRGAGDVAAGGVAVIRDMTHEHEVEKLKGEFLSNISHELRTPLTPIKGYAELLASKEAPADRTRSFARGILESTRKLERIVALLVDFSSMEAGKLAPRPGAVDIASLVRSLAEEWSERANRHDVVAEVDGDLPAVTGDERLLRRTLEEILDNAVKFSPGGGRILLRARGVSANGAAGSTAVQVAISDEGIGIPADDLPTIFTDFHQVDASETRPYGGLGLGLALVQRIVEAHRGEVVVESEPERGTTLTITIPTPAEVRRREPS